MKLLEDIQSCPDLSQELKKNLATAGIKTFVDLAKLSRLSVISIVPKLKVRHLANLEYELKRRRLMFKPDTSISLDHFINQAKLFKLWKQRVFTYEQLDALTYEEFVEALGGPQSRFFRNKVAAREWMNEHKLTAKERHHLPYLTPKTAGLLYKAKLGTLTAVAKKSDYELAQILQGNAKPASPLTRARLIEIRYALYKAGISRPCKPL